VGSVQWGLLGEGFQENSRAIAADEGGWVGYEKEGKVQGTIPDRKSEVEKGRGYGVLCYTVSGGGWGGPLSENEKL